MSDSRPFFATSAKGIEPILADELRALGAQQVEPTRAGVAFRGSLETAYRVCLWSRLASRVMLPLATFPAADAEQLYQGVLTVRWSDHLGTEGTLAVDFASSESQITHTHFGALKVKDAIVDQLRTSSGLRPSVDTERPDVRVNVYVRRDVATVSLDLPGESLHRRGYRSFGGPAPMKENLAAAVLTLAGWPAAAREGAPLVDAMCGSGTLPIEAALMAADVAPGLLRRSFGFQRWRGHDAGAWNRQLAEARERDGRGRKPLPPIAGYDMDGAAIEVAATNAQRAGVRAALKLERRELAVCEPIGDKPGIFVVNPPYGERLGELAELERLYRRIGDTLKQRFKGWRGFVFTGNLELSKSIGLHIARRHVLYNGAIECRLFEIPIHPDTQRAESAPAEAGGTAEAAGQGEAAPSAPVAGPRGPKLSPGGEAFANRLRKDFKHLGKWAKREGVTCWRVYDADLPEYAVAVDLYEGKWVHVQEYEPPATVDPSKAEGRLHDALAAIPDVLGVPARDVFLKVRRRQKGASQYEKLGEARRFHEVHEGGHKFVVNFTDYLDTGLFLDHRLTRRLVGELARGRSFLNLFAYTATATVYAARGGATSTTSVDLSNTYLDWAERNLMLNGIGGARHALIRADCQEWVARETGRYGLIFLDPPTFSRSKSMERTFDVQRDHVELLKAVTALLEPGGVLIFSNNFRRFKMDAGSLADLAIEDISRQTLPPDFAGNPRIHNAWRITRR